MKTKKHIFTLIEVLVALTILTMGVASLLLLISSAGRRVEKAKNKWRKNHLLAQAVEYYMLYPPNTEIDKRFFPYEDYSVNCTYDSPQLPEGLTEQIDNKRLTAMKVDLFDKDGKEIDHIVVERIVGALER
jgi:Tfp pilus assembly protein PilV